jgi:hypothetical protein
MPPYGFDGVWHDTRPGVAAGHVFHKPVLSSGFQDAGDPRQHPVNVCDAAQHEAAEHGVKRRRGTWDFFGGGIPAG